MHAGSLQSLYPASIIIVREAGVGTPSKTVQQEIMEA